jgi:hypothetical protein
VTMLRKSSIAAFLVTATALLGTLVIDPPGMAPREAHAVVGRPFTPVSFAGVARRTTRRTAYRSMAYTGAYPGAYMGGAAYVNTLPSGCASSPYSGYPYYNCDSTWYRPYYQGTTIIYQTVPPP